MKKYAVLFALSLLPLAMPVHAADYVDTYDIDASHASIVFKINHLGFSHTFGMFPGVSGTLKFDEKDASANAIEVTVDAASVNTMHEGRDEHLRNEDFFHVEKHKEISFKSTAWEKSGDNTYKVSGDLTLLGVTKPITFEARELGSGKGMKGEFRRGFETTFTIKRSDFGMEKMVGPIGDEVELTISFEAILQELEAPAQL